MGGTDSSLYCSSVEVITLENGFALPLIADQFLSPLRSLSLLPFHLSVRYRHQFQRDILINRAIHYINSIASNTIVCHLNGDKCNEVRVNAGRY